MANQDTLKLSTKSTGPVECLGRSFRSEEERSEHYLKLLAEKLKDPEFRKIEGFPIGKDEDILALSDPPYYTACPNPWIGDFIKAYGTEYDPKEPYHREPFESDLEESRNNDFVNAHSYATKTPHQAIMRLLIHFTKPGDVILDSFGGTGMSAVAAQLCAQPDHEFRANVGQNNSKAKWGHRCAIVGDLGPAATFISRNFNCPDDRGDFAREVENISNNVKDELGWMFKTRHTNGAEVETTCVLWSDYFTCPNCAHEFNYWEEAVNLNAGKIDDEVTCPACRTVNSKTSLGKCWTTVFDKALKKNVQQIKCKPVLILYDYGGKRHEKIPDKEDLALIEKIDNLDIRNWYPTVEVPLGFNTEQPKRSHGLTHVHHFFTKRNLAALACAWKHAHSLRARFLLTSLMYKSSVFCAPLMSNFFASRNGKSRGGWVGKERSGTLYCPSIHSEVMLLPQISSRFNPVQTCAESPRRPFITTQSATTLRLPDNCIDYIFTDPPFGANRMYSELNFLWESWLGVLTATATEAIENSARNKTLSDYKTLMVSAFKEYFRVLKPGRWISVEFSNTQATVWNTIQAILGEAGFIVAGVAGMHKQQGSIEAYTSTTAVKQDLIISAYKPNGGLEERFAKRGETEEGAWDFVRTHLKNLPVSKIKGGQMEILAERDPRILYDRMVAFYVGHSTPVPLSSAEFQAALAEKFPERDGMFFLTEQVNEYDKKRAQVENIGQLSIFVEDERSAINWLRASLKDKPQTVQDINPDFMQQLNASWKKWEARPELRALLDQNYLKYDGTGEVPSQIHSYLSTQFKELRNLPKDHAQLRHKAKDRWYVPDPKNLIQVEAIRNKRLLEEFWSYLPDGYTPPVLLADRGQTLPGLTTPRPKVPKNRKLKEVRTEAVRAGFKHCYQQKDYQTILAVADMLPESILNEDEQLQMIYDNAAMRSGVEM
jgi:DNA modification methylase